MLSGSNTMSPAQKRVVIAGIMLSVFMASMESTVVATAMPTIAGQLGGLDRYSWVFAAYLLTSTTTTPLFGKLSDILGRRGIYAIGMVVFLVGSLWCGLARSMDQLVWARALQGIGAGGVLPLAFIMIGEMFSLQERARMQGVFSGVWGVSSVVGPLLGGFIVDALTWHWVFYINLLPGVVALALVWFAWRDAERPQAGRRAPVDYLGAVLLSTSVVALMLGLQGGAPRGQTVGLLAGAVVLFLVLFAWERRVPDPILPLALFRGRLFSIGIAHAFFSGWAMFGSLSYVPLFAQAVLGTSATAAGITVTPMMLSWVVASIVSSRLLLRVNYRTLALVGMVLLTLGALLMSFAGESSSRAGVMFDLGLMGAGMGLSIPAFLIAIQSTVERRALGSATSMLQFSRSIGGTVGVAVAGAVLSLRVAAELRGRGGAADLSALNGLLAGGEGAAAAPVVVDAAVRTALAHGIAAVFALAFVAALLGLIATLFAPGGTVAALADRRRHQEESVAPDGAVETAAP